MLHNIGKTSANTIRMSPKQFMCRFLHDDIFTNLFLFQA